MLGVFGRQAAGAVSAAVQAHGIADQSIVTISKSVAFLRSRRNATLYLDIPNFYESLN